MSTGWWLSLHTGRDRGSGQCVMNERDSAIGKLDCGMKTRVHMLERLWSSWKYTTALP
jgi:hypothetical protein